MHATKNPAGTPLKLSRATLSGIGAGVVLPGFDPGALRAGIVHLGLGGFHRAHMARYTHDLMQSDPDALQWGIIGAGLLPADRRMHAALAPQDGLYTLSERGADGEAVSVIAALQRTIYAGDSTRDLLDAIADPAIRIVSLTVTEHGYCLDRATKQLDPSHQAIRRDLAAPDEPVSAIGIITEALRRRMAAEQPAFTALSCDNIERNGHVLRGAVLALARLRDPALADWIAAHGRFPSTMVDRITPVTTDADREHLAARYGVADAWPVVAEPFRQWVIEDDFACGRPAWESAGAQFVADVAPYEFMKLRLLNASHLAVAGLGQLAGFETIDQAMRHADMAAYMAALMARETGPTLAPVPGIDLDAYKRALITRFSNPALRDTVQRVNTDAPLNVLLDPIRDRLAAGESVELLALALAAWLRRMSGQDDAGRALNIQHPLAALLREKAALGGPDPRHLLNIGALFGALGGNETLVAAVARWLAPLSERGAIATLHLAARELSFAARAPG